MTDITKIVTPSVQNNGPTQQKREQQQLQKQKQLKTDDSARSSTPLPSAMAQKDLSPSPGGCTLSPTSTSSSCRTGSDSKRSSDLPSTCGLSLDDDQTCTTDSDSQDGTKSNDSFSMPSSSSDPSSEEASDENNDADDEDESPASSNQQQQQGVGDQKQQKSKFTVTCCFTTNPHYGMKLSTDNRHMSTSGLSPEARTIAKGHNHRWVSQQLSNYSKTLSTRQSNTKAASKKEQRGPLLSLDTAPALSPSAKDCKDSSKNSSGKGSKPPSPGGPNETFEKILMAAAACHLPEIRILVGEAARRDWQELWEQRPPGVTAASVAASQHETPSATNSANTNETEALWRRSVFMHRVYWTHVWEDTIGIYNFVLSNRLAVLRGQSLTPAASACSGGDPFAITVDRFARRIPWRGPVARCFFNNDTVFVQPEDDSPDMLSGGVTGCNRYSSLVREAEAMKNPERRASQIDAHRVATCARLTAKWGAFVAEPEKGQQNR